MKRFFIASAFCLVAAGLAADRPLYIQSPAARLLSAPRMDAPGPPLTRGDRVMQTGEEGSFFRVTGAPGSGFVPRLFASAFAPGQKVNYGNSIDRDTSTKARARASNYSETASARGLSESQNLRTRGGIHDFDFDSIEWIERLDIPSDAEPPLKEASGE